MKNCSASDVGLFLGNDICKTWLEVILTLTMTPIQLNCLDVSHKKGLSHKFTYPNYQISSWHL